MIIDIEGIKKKVREATVKNIPPIHPNEHDISARVSNCELALVELAELILGGDDSG